MKDIITVLLKLASLGILTAVLAAIPLGKTNEFN